MGLLEFLFGSGHQRESSPPDQQPPTQSTWRTPPFQDTQLAERLARRTPDDLAAMIVDSAVMAAMTALGERSNLFVQHPILEPIVTSDPIHLLFLPVVGAATSLTMLSSELPWPRVARIHSGLSPCLEGYGRFLQARGSGAAALENLMSYVAGGPKDAAFATLAGVWAVLNLKGDRLTAEEVNAASILGHLLGMTTTKVTKEQLLGNPEFLG